MSEPTIAPVVDRNPHLSSAERASIYRRNFFCFLGDLLLFSIAIQFIDASTVVPDFVRKLTDSEILIAMSSQVFSIGYLMPQLLVARSLTRVAHKKWWFVGPNIPIRFLVLVFAGVIVLLENQHHTWILIAFFVVYGIAALGDGLVGVPWIDLIGSSLDDKRRARLFGWGNALVGVMMLFLAPVAGYILGEPINILGWHIDLPDLNLSFPHNYALLFAVSGVIFALTIPAGLFIRELPGGKPRLTAPPLREYLPELLTVLREDHSFRAMIIVRVLFAFFAIATPFYIGLATDHLGLSSGTAVRNLLFMKTVGIVSGSLLFARIGDRRTTFIVRFGLGLGMLQPIFA
ncbi:MAG: hypothetical protein JXA10_17785, partial [Anaerolineae bacterium]|nr:hypothetical protein [Anaerolineae bacterium]